jgi:glycosyltransferase involved in cell wall biosynthesis
MLSALERHYGPLANSRVVPNGRDPALFPPGAKEPFILVAGRLWDEAKNVALVDKVAPSLPWPVYIAGEDHHPAGGQAHFRAVEPLRQLGASALSRWLARAAIFALPARYEPFGLSILEAGLAGYTLVLGDIPSLREVGDDAAAFVPPDDADGLAGTLQTLIQNPAHLTGLAAAARRRALRFTSQRMCADYLRVYRELLQDGQRQRRDGGARAISTSRGDRAIGGLRNGA